MQSTSEVNKGLIAKILDSFEWEDIYKMYKVLGIKVGKQQIKINGLNSKEKTTPESIRKELDLVLNYIIDNDVPELQYGPWIICWVNGEWEIEITPESPDEDSLIVPILESKLQVDFIPQSATVKEFLDIDDIPVEDIEGIEELLIYESRLKKAIDNEEWMIASKLRDLIEEIKKEK